MVNFFTDMIVYMNKYYLHQFRKGCTYIRGKYVILDASTWYLPMDICLFIHGHRNVTYGQFNVVVLSRTYKPRFSHYPQPSSAYLWLPQTLSLWCLDRGTATGFKPQCQFLFIIRRSRENRCYRLILVERKIEQCIGFACRYTSMIEYGNRLG